MHKDQTLEIYRPKNTRAMVKAVMTKTEIKLLQHKWCERQSDAE